MSNCSVPAQVHLQAQGSERGGAPGEKTLFLFLRCFLLCFYMFVPQECAFEIEVEADDAEVSWFQVRQCSNFFSLPGKDMSFPQKSVQISSCKKTNNDILAKASSTIIPQKSVQISSCKKTNDDILAKASSTITGKCHNSHISLIVVFKQEHTLFMICGGCQQVEQSEQI